MARRKSTTGGDGVAALPRGRHGLSPAGRRVAAGLAARAWVFAGPLLRRGEPGAVAGFVQVLRRRALLPVSPHAPLADGLWLPAYLLARHDPLASVFRPRGRGTVAGHRELYLRLARLRHLAQPAHGDGALGGPDPMSPADDSEEAGPRDWAGYHPLATGAAETEPLQGRALVPGRPWAVEPRWRPIAHAVFAAEVLARWSDDAGAPPPAGTDDVASPRALQRGLSVWLAALGAVPDLAQAPRPTLPGALPGAPSPSHVDDGQSAGPPALTAHALAPPMAPSQPDARPAPVTREDRRAILERALARRHWQPSFALAGPPPLALTQDISDAFGDGEASPALLESTEEEEASVGRGLPAYTALPGVLALAASLQRKAAPGSAPPTLAQRAQAVVRAAPSVGAPLEAGTQQVLARALGPTVDLEAVRVHSGPAAGEATAAVGAQAFTLGRDVYFAPGAYAPGTAGGLALLGHEVVHTAQQQGGHVRRADAGAEPGEPSEPGELEGQAEQAEEHVHRALAALPAARGLAGQPALRGSAGELLASGGPPLPAALPLPAAATAAPLPMGVAGGGALSLSAAVMDARQTRSAPLAAPPVPLWPAPTAGAETESAVLPTLQRAVGAPAWAHLARTVPGAVPLFLPPVLPAAGPHGESHAAVGDAALTPRPAGASGAFPLALITLAEEMPLLHRLPRPGAGSASLGHQAGPGGGDTRGTAPWRVSLGEEASVGRGLPAYTALPGVLALAASLQRKAAPGSAPPTLAQRAQAVVRAAPSVGAPLEAGTQQVLARALGPTVDLEAVRVHSGPAAGEATAAVGAQAFTLGRDVYFAPGAYAPGTAGGLALLGHEVVHTAQQQGGHVRRADAGAEPGEPSEPGELEGQAEQAEEHVHRALAALPAARGLAGQPALRGSAGELLASGGPPLPAAATATLAGAVIARWSALPVSPTAGGPGAMTSSAAVADAGISGPRAMPTQQIERRWLPASSAVLGAATGASATFDGPRSSIADTSWEPIAQAAAGAETLAYAVAQRVATGPADHPPLAGLAAEDAGQAPLPGASAPSVFGALSPAGRGVSRSLVDYALTAGQPAAVQRSSETGVLPGPDGPHRGDPLDHATPPRWLDTMDVAAAHRTAGSIGSGGAVQRASDASWPFVPGSLAAGSMIARAPDGEATTGAAELAALLSSRAAEGDGHDGNAPAALSAAGSGLTPRLGGALAGVLAGLGQSGGAPAAAGGLLAGGEDTLGLAGPVHGAGGSARSANLSSASPEVAQGAGPSPAGAGTEEAPAQAASSAPPTVDDLVNQVLSRVRRQLALEHERAGGFLPELLR